MSQVNFSRASEIGESAQLDLGQSERSTEPVLDLGKKLHGLNLVSDGLVLNFDNVRFDGLQSSPEFESISALDLFDSNEIELNNFLPEHESNFVQTDSCALSQKNSEANESSEFSGNPTGLIPLPHLLSFDELPEI